MKKSIYSFVFRCSGCGKIYDIQEKYEENKEYTCPGCKITSVIKRKDVKYTAKADPFAFECAYCHKIQRTYDYEFQKDVEGLDVTTVKCPDCNKQNIFKYECAYHYFSRRGGGGRK